MHSRCCWPPTAPHPAVQAVLDLAPQASPAQARLDQLSLPATRMPVSFSPRPRCRRSTWPGTGSASGRPSRSAPTSVTRCAGLVDVAAVQQDLTGQRGDADQLVHPVQDAQERRLAAARRPDQRRHHAQLASSSETRSSTLWSPNQAEMLRASSPASGRSRTPCPLAPRNRSRLSRPARRWRLVRTQPARLAHRSPLVRFPHGASQYTSQQQQFLQFHSTPAPPPQPDRPPRATSERPPWTPPPRPAPAPAPTPGQDERAHVVAEHDLGRAHRAGRERPRVGGGDQVGVHVGVVSRTYGEEAVTMISWSGAGSAPGPAAAQRGHPVDGPALAGDGQDEIAGPEPRHEGERAAEGGPAAEELDHPGLPGQRRVTQWPGPRVRVSGLVPCTTTMSRIPMLGMSRMATGFPGVVGPSGAT